MARTEIIFLPKATVAVTRAIDHDTPQQLKDRVAAIKAEIATVLQRAMDRGEIDLEGYGVYIAFEDIGEPTLEDLGNSR